MPCIIDPRTRSLSSQPPCLHRAQANESYMDFVFSFLLTLHRGRRWRTEGKATPENFGGGGSAEDQIRMLESWEGWREKSRGKSQLASELSLGPLRVRARVGRCLLPAQGSGEKGTLQMFPRRLGKNTTLLPKAGGPAQLPW